jgi:RNA polymerase sporulation-specific sigma factor
MYNRLKMLSDEALIEIIHFSTESTEQMYATDLLMERYKELVRSKARTYFLIGADRDDVVQEGMIGLYKAIKDYKFDKDSSFRSFAQLCIVRQILSAIRVSSRLKHLPLNEYISLDRSVNDEDGKETTMMELLPDPNSLTPEEILTGIEERRRLDEKIEGLLSSMEKRVLQLFLEGLDYMQIAEKLGKKPKSVDNALQRVKQKITQMLQV